VVVKAANDDSGGSANESRVFFTAHELDCDTGHHLE
jgi:hypothetical protein